MIISKFPETKYTNQTHLIGIHSSPHNTRGRTDRYKQLAKIFRERNPVYSEDWRKVVYFFNVHHYGIQQHVLLWHSVI